MNIFRTKYFFAVLTALCLGLVLTTSAFSSQGRTDTPDVSQGTNGPSQPSLSQPSLTNLTLNITNAYALNIPQAKYAVELVNSAGETIPATGETSYSVRDKAGSCTIVCQVPKDEYTVAALKLLNPANDIAFEWLTYAVPQALADNAVTLDVANNKFADTAGDGSQAHPFLVGNPRQLDNLRGYCDGQTKYYVEQIADIDFEGSCGITIQMSGDNDNIVATPVIVDDTARFYNKDKAGKGSLGWVYIGCDMDLNPEEVFVGSYTGNGHTIDGVVAYNPGAMGEASLFGGCCMEKISGLTIGPNSSFYGKIAAGLAGGLFTPGAFVPPGASGDEASEKTAMENCTVAATVCGAPQPGEYSARGIMAGGLVAEIMARNATIEDCAFSGQLYCGGAFAEGGGLVCMCESPRQGAKFLMRNCKVTGRLIADTRGTYVGGLLCGCGGDLTAEACQITATCELKQSKDEHPATFIGGLATFMSSSDQSLHLGPGNVLALTFDCSQVKTEADGKVAVGGVYYAVYGVSEANIKAAIAGKVDISGNICQPALGEGFVYRKYCAEPALDSLGI